MATSTILAGTWDDGVLACTEAGLHREHAGAPVTGLASDGDRGALAIVDGRSLCRRGFEGGWQVIATSERSRLVCGVAVGAEIYVGTDDAQILRVERGRLHRLEGFAHVAGRDQWYAGSALVDGRLMGPPLGIRSMSATCDHAALLANVHVGGIPRSVDCGETWQPTIDINCDVHQVCAHPASAGIVIAAAASGLCISRDGGATWKIETQGLHATYCSAVAFVGDDIYVAASTDHFASQGAVYRRPLNGAGSLRLVGGGFPRWVEGIVDTDNIAARGEATAIADRSGKLYVSEDAGRSWALRERLSSPPSSLFIY
jgi:hypothetical protein